MSISCGRPRRISIASSEVQSRSICRAHHVSIRNLILHEFLAELSNRTESLTVNVRYLAFSIADNASRF